MGTEVPAGGSDTNQTWTVSNFGAGCATQPPATIMLTNIMPETVYVVPLLPTVEPVKMVIPNSKFAKPHKGLGESAFKSDFYLYFIFEFHFYLIFLFKR